MNQERDSYTIQTNRIQKSVSIGFDRCMYESFHGRPNLFSLFFFLCNSYMVLIVSFFFFFVRAKDDASSFYVFFLFSESCSFRTGVFRGYAVACASQQETTYSIFDNSALIKSLRNRVSQRNRFVRENQFAFPF